MFLTVIFGPSGSLISISYSMFSSAFSLRAFRLVQPSNLRRGLLGLLYTLVVSEFPSSF
jgi:hypothetical protein